MDINLSDYAALMGDYAGSIAGIIVSAATVAVVVLLLSLLVLFLLKKFVLVKRRHIILRIFSISYFVLIPIICAFFAFKWQALNKLGNNLSENITKDTKIIDNTIKAKIAEVTDGLYLDKSENLEGKIPISVNDLIDILSDSLYTNYLQYYKLEHVNNENKLLAKAIDLYVEVTKSKGVSFLFKEGLSRIISKELKLEKETTKEMMDTKLGKLFDDGIITKIFDTKIRGFFGGMKNSVLITLFIILLLPAIEIGIAYWLFKKDTKILEQSAQNIPLTDSDSV